MYGKVVEGPKIGKRLSNPIIGDQAVINVGTGRD
jgi:hypothetical protein